MKYWWAIALGIGLVFFAGPAIEGAVISAIRTPDDILAAVAQVNPAGAPDLQPNYLGAGYTWCNKFMYRVLGLLGISIPFAPTLVNDQISYIDAGNDGWYPVSAADAQAAALAGKVAIATYYNFAGHGHMALVLPYAGPMQIAQAGERNFNQGSVGNGFGLIQPQFYAHA